MLDKIYKVYNKYREMVYKEYAPFDYLKVIILIKPKNYFELMEEVSKTFAHIQLERDVAYIELAGIKTPVLIDNELPENVEFQILSQKDYEREEQEKLYRKIAKLFDN